MENTREIILDGLLTLEKESIYSNKLINDILDKYDYLEPRDKAFMKRCFEGVVERRIELDYHLGNLSSVPVRKMKPLIRNLLRMSAYQILYMDSIPDSAAINEAVKLSKKRKFQSLSGFVNANLRNLSRNKENLTWPDKKKDFILYAEVKYSVPGWIVEKWVDIYGQDDTEAMLTALLAIHPVSIRFDRNLSEKQIEGYVKQMEESGISLIRDKRLSYVYKASGVDGVSNLPGFEEGAFVIQDVSSCLAVEALELKKGDYVVDACAAPGGKSILAAQIVLNETVTDEDKKGTVISRDLTEYKVARIEENAQRMGLTNIKPQVWDATNKDSELISKADALILDVPCSGLGILGKKRDIKYNVSPEGLEDIVKLQRQIVLASWEYLKPGGKLLYSTCTINPFENEKQVQWIIENLPFEKLVDCTQLIPGKDDCDGFFYTVLRRK